VSLSVAVAIVATAQETPRFTVASIQRSADDGPGMAVQPMAEGRYFARKVPVIALLTAAYELSPERIIGAPAWRGERYDIQARYDPAAPSGVIPRTTVLLQSLLRERFGLVAHMEKRDFPIFVLRVVRSDGRLGRGLQPSSINCGDRAAASAARQQNAKAANGAPACDAVERPDAFIAGGTNLDVVARALRIPAGRHVINDTGLPGTWDVTLEFSPLADTGGDKPNVFTALREQLGLQLEPTRGALDVLIIDAISRPTPN
jgi:uncharacterized protein (TIGR03435 family)